MTLPGKKPHQTKTTKDVKETNRKKAIRTTRITKTKTTSTTTTAAEAAATTTTTTTKWKQLGRGGGGGGYVFSNESQSRRPIEVAVFRLSVIQTRPTFLRYLSSLSRYKPSLVSP